MDQGRPFIAIPFNYLRNVASCRNDVDSRIPGTSAGVSSADFVRIVDEGELPGSVIRAEASACNVYRTRTVHQPKKTSV
jgi:hypothetical protein